MLTVLLAIVCIFFLFAMPVVTVLAFIGFWIGGGVGAFVGGVIGFFIEAGA